MAKRAQITALHEHDIKDLLERIGLAAAYADGTLVCSVCHERVQDHGLGAVRMEKGQPLVSCGKLECLEDFYE
jgi:hypothetical protein